MLVSKSYSPIGSIQILQIKSDVCFFTFPSILTWRRQYDLYGSENWFWHLFLIPHGRSDCTSAPSIVQLPVFSNNTNIWICICSAHIPYVFYQKNLRFLRCFCDLLWYQKIATHRNNWTIQSSLSIIKFICIRKFTNFAHLFAPIIHLIFIRYQIFFINSLLKSGALQTLDDSAANRTTICM